eukprot:88475-Alexandrium_andersonii.AAC.1
MRAAQTTTPLPKGTDPRSDKRKRRTTAPQGSAETDPGPAYGPPGLAIARPQRRGWPHALPR